MKGRKAMTIVKNRKETVAIVDKEFQYMLGCTKCPLHKERKNVVVGKGPTRGVKYMLVGEAPGKDEDEAGLPFVGRSGALLSKALAQAGFKEEELFITNIVRCRPPGNRRPTGSEIKACSSHLRFQIELVGPKILIVAGGTALAYFFPKDKITSVHGKLMTTRTGKKIFPIFHPAYILRNPEMERHLVDDLKKLRKIDITETISTAIGPKIVLTS